MQAAFFASSASSISNIRTVVARQIYPQVIWKLVPRSSVVGAQNMARLVLTAGRSLLMGR